MSWMTKAKGTRVEGDMKPGGGGRFRALETKLEAEPGVRNPAALAASIGRKKYGSKKMGAWSSANEGPADSAAEVGSGKGEE